MLLDKDIGLVGVRPASLPFLRTGNKKWLISSSKLLNKVKIKKINKYTHH